MSSNAAAMSVLQSFSNDLASAVERAGRSVVAIHARRRIPASGVIWRDGVIVGANHTIQRDEDITVSFADGTTAAATIAGRDATTDIAVLRIDPTSHPAAEAGNADDLRVGALVLALGRPGSSVTASMGVISAVGGEWRTWHGGRIDRLVRLDLAIYDGFSGGPLVDAGGRVLGINTSALSRAAALAIPSVTVERVADQLLAQGRVRRGYVGLGMQPVRLGEALVKELALEGDVGLMVVSVEPGGPADRAGILLGDVLLSLDGIAVSDPSELMALLSGERVGTPATARLVRAGKLTEVGLTIGERQPRSSSEQRPPRRRGGR
jgi:S1-C subfamily serine protease